MSGNLGYRIQIFSLIMLVINLVGVGFVVYYLFDAKLYLWAVFAIVWGTFLSFGLFLLMAGFGQLVRNSDRIVERRLTVGRTDKEAD